MESNTDSAPEEENTSTPNLEPRLDSVCREPASTLHEAACLHQDGVGYPAVSPEREAAVAAPAPGLEEDQAPQARRGLPPPVPPKVPSLDELSNDDFVPSELPAVVLSSQQEPEGVMSLSAIRTLVVQRRIHTALKHLTDLSNFEDKAEARLLRLRCLVAMRRYAEAAEECKQMGSEAASFEVRFFLAQLPWLLHADAYQSMLQLKALAQSWSSKGGESWEDRLELLQVLSHLSLAVGHGRMAAAELQRAVSEATDSAGRQLWSLLGRHHLSGGNLTAADAAFEKAKTYTGQDATVLLNSGFRAMAMGEFQAARDAFETAAADDTEGARLQEILAAENNLAVCKFYTKDLRGACERLKALVTKDPVRFLKPCLLQNLTSLYEFSQDAAGLRKALRDLAGAAQLEDLEPRLFQAPT
ncbi:ABCC1 [Symbiodinium pilosum]|uniref:ABCC1 protein n=1 Tax=Symbiodinium pilosum TaxID=2952 RepID=A0A812WP84_SYMPI|nr:ABCC1 [Symbiodinium pilosum]